MNCVLLRIIYSPEWRSWGVIRYDADEEQIGEGEWFHGLSEARARADQIASHLMRIETYYKDGGLRSSAFGKRHTVE